MFKVIEQAWKNKRWHEENSVEFKKREHAMEYARTEADGWLTVQGGNNTYWIEANGNYFTVFRNGKRWYRYQVKRVQSERSL